MGYRLDRKASGVVAQLQYDFPIPRTWEPAKPTINLHISHSSLLLPDLSGMTVYYNDVPLMDMQLTAENQRDSWLEIPVPATALRSGQHNLNPYPFNMDRDLANTTMLLPDSPTASEIEGALKLAAKFGHESRHKTLQLDVKTANEWDDQADAEDHLILIGDGERNSASAELQEELLGMTAPTKPP